jgi:hypothetical protein
MSIMRYIIIVILALISIGSAYGQRNRIELWQLKYAQAAGYVPYSKANGEYEATALSSLITGVSIDDAFVLNDSLYFVFSDGDTLNAGYLPLSATIIDSLYMQGDSLVITQDTIINKVDLSQFRQTLTISNDTLFISGGNSVILPASGGGGTDTSGYNTYFNLTDQTLSIGDYNDTLAVTLPIVGINAGTGITTNSVNGVVTITNSAPDQVVTITGAGINSVSGSYPSYVITGSEVDGSITNEGILGVGAGGANTSLITSNTSTATGVTVSGGTGIGVSESTSTNGGTITITNNAPDQTVVLNAGTGITTSGTYPNFTITNSAPDQVVTLAGTGITTITGSYPSFTINSTEVDGSVTNELQTLSRNQDTIFISSGNYVILPAASGIDSIFQSGDTVYIVAAGDTSFFVIPPAVGDNWGSQVVISDTTLVGNGTSGNPLGVDTTQIATHYYISEGFTTKYIDFDTLYANNYQEGRIKWNVDENSVEIGLSANLSGTALMDDFWYVKNQSGNSIAKGSVVYASGTLGTSGRILVDKYIANGTIDSKYVLGVVAETIPNGEDGYVMTKGKIRGINTSAYVDGTVLWASTAVAGTLTDTVPVAPNFRLPLAFVVHANANGILAVRTTTGSDLYEDHRVQVTTPTAGQLLQYNGTNQRWENWTPNFALSDTSGRNNYLALSNDTLYVGDDNDTLNVLLPYYPNTNPNGYISTFTDTSGYNNYFNLSSQTLSIGDANDTLTVTLPIVGVSAGTGITVNTTSGVATVTNAAPDQTVTISGTGITVSGTYPSFTLTAADQSATNEIQTLSLSNDTLTISSGNSVKLTNAAVLQIVDITVTTDTLELADLGKLVRCNNAGAITLRIPTNANHAFPIGSIVTVEQVGAGVVTIAPVSGVTINPTARKTWGQYSVIQLIKVGTDTWNVVGASS